MYSIPAMVLFFFCSLRVLNPPSNVSIVPHRRQRIRRGKHAAHTSPDPLARSRFSRPIRNVLVAGRRSGPHRARPTAQHASRTIRTGMWFLFLFFSAFATGHTPESFDKSVAIVHSAVTEYKRLFFSFFLL